MLSLYFNRVCKTHVIPHYKLSFDSALAPALDAYLPIASCSNYFSAFLMRVCAQCWTAKHLRSINSLVFCFQQCVNSQSLGKERVYGVSGLGVLAI